MFSPHRMTKNLLFNLVLLVLIIAEYLFLFVLFDKHVTGQTFNAIGFFVSSLAIGMLLIAKFYNKSVVVAQPKKNTRRKNVLLFALYCGCLLVANMATNDIIKSIDYNKYSDVIPTIVLLTKSFLAGHFPYGREVLAPLGYHNSSSYLTMHWLPFTFAEWFHVDYRTISFSVWCLGAGVIMLRSKHTTQNWLQIMIPPMLMLAYVYIAFCDRAIIGVTVEIMICGYYMLLMYSLNQKKVWLSGLIISSCMLSRYYIALWIPLYAFVLFVSGERKSLFKIAACSFVFVLALYIVPFLSKDWGYLYRTYVSNYENATYYEWFNLNGDGLPAHLFSGIGLAHLFYLKYRSTNLMVGFKLLEKIFFLANITVLGLMMVWYWFNRKKMITNIFLMASFKIYLSVFLAFIVLPYRYLAITSIFVSIAIFAEQLRYTISESESTVQPY